MDFDVAEPIRIQDQDKPDECTSAALAAIAEDVIGKRVNEDYIYGNSVVNGTFGIIPAEALNAVIQKGVIAEGFVQPQFPFSSYRSSWPWIFRFDSIISMMRKNQRSFFCGIAWRAEWTLATDGIMVASNEQTITFPHAFKIFGVVTKNGIPYLKIQNSLGSDKGDHGIWYMPKEIANTLDFAYQPY